MKRLIVALVPWMVFATAAFGQARPADVAYTHFPTLEGKAFRVLDECFVPITSLSGWGWSAQVREGFALIEAEGRDLRMPIRTLNGTQAIPLRSAIDQLGGESSWMGNRDRLEVLSRIRHITVESGRIIVEATLAVKPAVFKLPDPSRIVVELAGARLDRRAEQILDSGGRAFQSQPTVVRVLMTSESALPVTADVAAPTRRFELNINPPDPVAKGEETDDPPIKDPASAPGPDLALPSGTPISATIETPSPTSLILQLSGPIGQTLRMRKPEPNRLEFVFPGANVTLPPDFRFSSETLTGVSARFEDGSSIIQLDLKRPMVAEVIPGAREVKIQFMRPSVGDGRLAGKTIVVDAGHGGRASGCRCGSIYEKNMTLAISKVLSQKLSEAGATVIMTRKSDIDLGLVERAEIANRNGADFFISVHINSNGVSNSTSGGITFYHKQDPIKRLLAECIQREIAKVSGLPSMGAWSDQRIYKTGFSVLRNSTMPGVLIEMGFINHWKDRKRMLEPDFHQDVSSAIVKGLKVFLGDEQAQKKAN